MGVTTHLQVQKTKPIDPYDPRARILFERKVFIPLGWFLFFSPDDVSLLEDGSSYAAVGVRPGLARAKRRVRAVSRVGTPRLVGALHAYLDAVERAGAGFLVLHPYRVGSSKKDLQRPMAWLDSLVLAPSRRTLKRGEALFADDDEGPTWEDPDGNRAMDCESIEDVIGWPIRAPKVKWKHPPTPDPVVDPTQLEATRQREVARRAQDEALRRPVTDLEFSDALASGDDAHVRLLFKQQQRANEPLRVATLIEATWAAKRFTALTEFFAGLSAERQAVVAHARLEQALAGHEGVGSLLVDVDRSDANRELLAPFARRVFEAWKGQPATVALGLSPILYALPTVTFTRSEWERIARGARDAGNEALIWRCEEHRAASNAR